ncbi:MAG: DoxX family protein [Rhodothermia bacterium]|nr:DoxX family protein [Rhodothermia bacterium]
MEVVFQAMKILSIALFLFYGIDCLRSEKMHKEFERFGLSRYRTTVGTLEILGAVGLLVGYLLPLLVAISSAGLTLLMLLGVATRIRVGDSVIDTLPAFLLMLANAFILLYAVSWIG